MEEAIVSFFIFSVILIAIILLLFGGDSKIYVLGKIIDKKIMHVNISSNHDSDVKRKEYFFFVKYYKKNFGPFIERIEVNEKVYETFVDEDLIIILTKK